MEPLSRDTPSPSLPSFPMGADINDLFRLYCTSLMHSHGDRGNESGVGYEIIIENGRGEKIWNR